MELTISQSDLSYALQTALGSVPNKSTLPILQALLLEAEEGHLRITGTDLEVTTSVTVPVLRLPRADEPQSVQARHFADAVRKLPKGDVRVQDAERQADGSLRQRQRKVAGPQARRPGLSQAAGDPPRGPDCSRGDGVQSRLIARAELRRLFRRDAAGTERRARRCLGLRRSRWSRPTGTAWRVLAARARLPRSAATVSSFPARR